MPLVHAAYFSFLLSGAAEALYEQDMRLVLCPTMHEHDREVSLLDRLMHGTTDGALIILPEESSDELERLLDHGYRFVVDRSAAAAERADPCRVGRAHVRRRPGDEAPALPRAHADRAPSPGRAAWMAT